MPKGAAMLIGYYDTPSNRRILLDSLSFVRFGADTVTHLGSCFMAAPPGGMQFSTKGAFDLPTKTTCLFSVVAANADGVLSPASTVEARLAGGVGFGLFLK